VKKYDQFHDGFLDGLLIEDRTVRVFLSTDDKQAFILEASGVFSLKADGFRQGNIIYDVLIRDREEVTFHDAMNFYEFKDEANAVRKLEEMHRQNLVVLEINPSYGASCIILAESVELRPRQEPADRYLIGALDNSVS
jgi:hypothetical protein